MAYASCENCGERVYRGLCTNCHEENFIEDQYHDLGEPVPDSIYSKARENERAVEQIPVEYRSRR